MGDLPESWTVSRISLPSAREVLRSFISVLSILVQAPGSGFRERTRAWTVGESTPFWAAVILSKEINAFWRV